MSVPAGWYQDPAPGSSLQRFWDGSAWTQQTRPQPAAEASGSAAPQTPAAPQPADVSAEGGEKVEEPVEGPGSGKRRRSRRLSYGSPLAATLSALVWCAAAASVFFASSLIGWSESTLFPPLFWIP